MSKQYYTDVERIKVKLHGYEKIKEKLFYRYYMNIIYNKPTRCNSSSICRAYL